LVRKGVARPCGGERETGHRLGGGHKKREGRGRKTNKLCQRVGGWRRSRRGEKREPKRENNDNAIKKRKKPKNQKNNKKTRRRKVEREGLKRKCVWERAGV